MSSHISTPPSSEVLTSSEVFTMSSQQQNAIDVALERLKRRESEISKDGGCILPIAQSIFDLIQEDNPSDTIKVHLINSKHPITIFELEEYSVCYIFPDRSVLACARPTNIWEWHKNLDHRFAHLEGDRAVTSDEQIASEKGWFRASHLENRPGWFYFESATMEHGHRRVCLINATNIHQAVERLGNYS